MLLTEMAFGHQAQHRDRGEAGWWWGGVCAAGEGAAAADVRRHERRRHTRQAAHHSQHAQCDQPCITPRPPTRPPRGIG